MKVIIFDNNKIKSIIISVSVILLIILILIFSNKITDTIKANISLALNTLIPSLFPLILLSSIIICSNNAITIAVPFTKLITKVFRLNPKLAPAVVIGCLMGFPNSARYLASTKDTNELSHLISYTSNANPAYVYLTAGTIFGFSSQICCILLLSVIISSFILGILFRPKLNKDIIQQQGKKLNSIPQNVFSSKIIAESIISCFKTLAIIFTFTTIFSFLATMLVSALDLQETSAAICTSLLELTNGLNMLSKMSFSLETKAVLASFFISFSSIMILFQVFTAAQGLKIKFSKIIIYKFIQGIISSLITFSLIKLLPPKTIPAFSNIDVFSTTRAPELIYIFSVIIFFAYLYLRKNKHKSKRYTKMLGHKT